MPEMPLNIDSPVDEEILSCLDLNKPKSFFLFAGAGSGKTRSLVSALLKVREQSGQQLRLNRKKIAVITYTNAACDEIKHRIDYDALFFVSTIHSFVWELIKNYQHDIREWLRTEIALDIAELERLLAAGRPGTKTEMDRQQKIREKTIRLNTLDEISYFNYSPSGENLKRGSLNHSEVIKLAADFLLNRPLMQQILICKFPILFIDESQDTKKDLIDAFFHLQQQYPQRISLGLFGDTMQRIYNEGKPDLGVNLPADWLKPVKKLNFRCPNRVITLINKIRSQTDSQSQLPGKGVEEGIIRLFIIANDAPDKSRIEDDIAIRMAAITKDNEWAGDQAEVKTLTLEHHMAARRMGFSGIFEPLYQIDRLKTGLTDGSLSGMNHFTQVILPLFRAHQQNDLFSVARIVKQNSPLLQGAVLKGSKEQPALLKKANDSVAELMLLCADGRDPQLIEVIQTIARTGLFTLPSPLSVIAKRKLPDAAVETGETDVAPALAAEAEDEEDRDDVIEAWEKALQSNFSQVERYESYVSDNSRFGTHQGVKGLEFPRVMVILDDEEAKGFLFSYEKLFGVKPLSTTDLTNMREGKETSNMRTLRLFYVACSRAEKSLAIVAYTSDPVKLKSHVLAEDWFTADEIIVIDNQ